MKIDLLILPSGRCPIEDFFCDLSERDLGKILALVEILKESGSLPFPHARKLHGVEGLWELRAKSGGQAVRIFYMYTGKDQAVLISGFVKKSQKTPKREIDRALNLLKMRRINL